MTLSLLAACTLLCGLLVGFIPALVDSLKKSWQARLDRPVERLDWPIRLFYFTWLPAMPLAGWMLDHWHAQGVLFGGLIGLIVGIAWLGMVRSVRSLLANMVVLGIAYSVMTTCAIRLMAEVFFERSAPLASLNLGFIFVALGAWLGPEIFQWTERWWGYRHGLLYLSLACIVPAALAALSERELFRTPPPLADTWPEMLIDPQMALIGAIILVYFAIENCLEFWPERYIKEIGYENRGLRGAMFIFWLAFIATRGAAAWWLYAHPAQGIWLVLILVIISALLMGNLIGGYEWGSGSFGFLLVGACYGPMLPCFLGIALNLLPNLPAVAVGSLLAVSGLDTLIVRPLMHAFTADRPARTVMRIPTVLALLLAAPLLILAFVRA